jgi:hypothetical protein
MSNALHLFSRATLVVVAVCGVGTSAAAPQNPLPVLSGTYIFDGTWGGVTCLDSHCVQEQPLYLDHVHGSLTFGDTVPGSLRGDAVSGIVVQVALTGTLSGYDRLRTCRKCALDSASMDVTPLSPATLLIRNGAVQSVGFAVRVLNPYPPNRPRNPSISFLLEASGSGYFEANGGVLGKSYLRKQ